MNSRSTGMSTGRVTLVVTMVAASMTAEGRDSIRAGHNLLQDESSRPALAVGESLSPLAFLDTTGATLRLAELTPKGPVALVFLSTTCPLAKRYVGRLKLLHETYATRGVSIIGVFPNADETVRGVEQYKRTAGLPFPVVRDVDGYVARRLGATMTPQVFVVDKSSKLVYRGAIDDNRYENRVRERYLADALAASLAGKPVDVATTRAMGCSVHLPEPGVDEPRSRTPPMLPVSFRTIVSRATVPGRSARSPSRTTGRRAAGGKRSRPTRRSG